MREGSAASLVSGHYKHLGVTKQARIVDDKVAEATLTTVSFKAQYRAARSVRSFKVR